jgi:acetoin utilization deacetylase AcuC-like enzyme
VPEGHRFPMLKYELLPMQLKHYGIITPQQLVAPKILPHYIAALTHTDAYLHKLYTLTLSTSEQRAIGFTQSAKLIEREQYIMQGTLDCALYALRNNSVGLNIAGGTHHAFADKGEGFCLMNDLVIAAHYLLQQQLVKRVLIIDLDVHQGNGSASLCKHKPNIFTYSIHGAHNYPFHKEQSDWDIGLPDGTNGSTYLYYLQQSLPKILDSFAPDIALYQCGVDVLASDKYGKMNLTIKECQQRDAYVFTQLKQRGIPCAAAMGGGYSADINIIVQAHCNTFEQAALIFT